MAEDALSKSHVELQPNPGGIKLGPLWLQPGISPRNALTAYISSAAFGMRTDMKLFVAPKPSGSYNRASAVFRKKPEGWRYFCYTESFQLPIVYLQNLYELNVSPDYQKFYDQTLKIKG